MQEQVKAWRRQLDAAINSTRYLMGSREMSLAHTNLQRAFMWLGESLKALGSPTPYVNSSNPANAVIEPQADHSEHTLLQRWETIDQTQTARVKDFRYYLEQYIQAFKAWRLEQTENNTPDIAHCWQQSIDAAIEAKCWLGWELNRIKQVKDTEGTSHFTQPFILPL